MRRWPASKPRCYSAFRAHFARIRRLTRHVWAHTQTQRRRARASTAGREDGRAGGGWPTGRVGVERRPAAAQCLAALHAVAGRFDRAGHTRRLGLAARTRRGRRRGRRLQQGGKERAVVFFKTRRREHTLCTRKRGPQSRHGHHRRLSPARSGKLCAGKTRANQHQPPAPAPAPAPAGRGRAADGPAATRHGLTTQTSSRSSSSDDS